VATKLRGEKQVGRFSVQLEVANYVDVELAARGQLAPNKVRRQTIQGVVDSGAASLVLPGTVVKQLGLRLKRKVRVRYANNSRAMRWEATGVQVDLLGRDGLFEALVEPRRKDALIGAIVLEALDLLIDPKNQCLIPRYASGPLYELE
jgi:predicted aspartyl protease